MKNSYTLTPAAPANSYKRKPAAFSFSILMILVLCLGAGKGWGQTYYSMSTGNYSQTFTNLSTAYPTNINGLAILSTGSIPIATKTTTATNISLVAVGTSTAIGYDAVSANSTKMIFLSTTGTDNTVAVACDLNLDFTGRTASSLTFNYANILNSSAASPNGRSASLIVYYSTDGTNWTSLGGPYTVYNNTGASTTNVPISITLPSALDNQSTVKFRFYEYNGGTIVGSPTGSRPKISLDDITVSSSAQVSSTNFYSKSTGNLDDVVNWGTNTDGTGTAPANFTTANQVFNIRNNATPTIGAAWTVSGTNSKIIVGDGTNACNFTIPSSFAVTGTVDVSANGTLTNQNTTSPTFGTLTGTVVYDGSSAQNVTATTYTNLTIQNSAATKTAAGAITVSGVLNVAASTIFDMSTFALSGAALTTSGTGTLRTQNTAATPIPTGRTWSMDVQYNSASAQTVVAATHTNLDITGGNRTLIASGTINISGIYTPGAGTLTVTSNTINFSSASAQTIPAATYNSITNTGNGSRTFASGTITIGGTFTTGSGSYTVGTSTVVFNGASQVIPKPGGESYYNLTVAGTGTTTIANIPIIAAGGTFTVNASSTINMSTTAMSFGAGCFVAINGTLQTQAAAGFSGNVSTAIDVTNSPTITLGSSSTIEYNKSSLTQTITARDYRNITISGAATMSLGGNVTVQGSSTMTVSSNLACGNNTIAQSGSGTANITVTGTISTTNTDGLNGSAITTINSSNTSLTLGSSSTVYYASASAQTITAATYASITNTGGGARTLASSGTIDISGTLTTGAGNYTIGTSTVNFNGTSAQTIPVIPVASGGNYYNLTYSGSSTGTLGGSISLASNLTNSGSGTLALTATTAKTITILGNLVLTSGTLDWASNGATVAGSILLAGNITESTGVTNTTEALLNGSITFNGSGTIGSPQTISLTSNNTFQYTNLTINSGTVVQVNNSFILTGNATANYKGTLNVNGSLNLLTNTITSSAASAIFNLNSNGTLISSHTSGLNSSIPSSNMTRTFTAGANYTFNGITTTAFPTTGQQATFGSPANITVNANITLNRNITATGTVDLTDKVLTNTDNTLTLSGTITRTSGVIRGSATSNLVITGASGTIAFDQTTPGTTNVLRNLTISGSGTTTLGNALNITGGTTFGVVTVGTGATLATGGNLTLKSDATGTASIGTSLGTISGSVNVERFVSSSGRRWRFLSSPVSGKTIVDWRDQFAITGPGATTNTTVGDLNANGWHQTYNNITNATAATTTSVRTYVEANSTTLNLNLGWDNVTTGTTLAAGQGFRTFIRGPISDKVNQLGASGNAQSQAAVTLSLSGTINSGDISAPSLTYNQTGWNLLGNPYPCAFDWNAFHDAGRTTSGGDTSGTDYTKIGATIYIYDGTSNSYKSYSATANSGTLTNGIIPSGAGFFVKATASSPTLTFKETYKTTSSAPIALHKTMMSDEFTLKFLKDETESDEIIVKMLDGATLNKDGYDINKLENENLNLSAYGTDNNLLTLSAIPFVTEETRIKLNVEATEVGTYKFDFTNMDQFDAGISVSLLDKYTNKTTDVRANTKYTFEMGAGVNQWGKNRFEIILNGKATTGVNENTTNVTAAQLSVYPNPATDVLNISLSNGTSIETVNIYNVSGKLVNTAKVIANQINISDLSNGVYFIEVLTENGKLTTKFVK